MGTEQEDEQEKELDQPMLFTALLLPVGHQSPANVGMTLKGYS